MNGKTTVDSINPCSAEMDRNTWGFRWLNVCWWGRRWLKLHVLGVTLDLYSTKNPFKAPDAPPRCRPGATKVGPVFKVRTGNRVTVFFGCGCLSWPWPQRKLP